MLKLSMISVYAEKTAPVLWIIVDIITTLLTTLTLTLKYKI
jgi:hypothetical protein